ncbi:MAG: uroporphyrinogen-III synthase [Balneolaceae bacterium]
MENSKPLPKVLFTTDLSAGQQEVLKSTDYSFESLPFITFEYVASEEWKPKMKVNPDTWVFTSKRAVKAIKAVIDSLEKPEFIFAVGDKTARKLEKLSLSPIIPAEFNLESLAERMNNFKLKNVIHFCGNLKSGNLSELLKDKSIDVTSIEVYRTNLNPQKVEESKYDSFVFMSPSAVESFSQKNTLHENSTVFCIGPSTAKALEKAGLTTFITAEESTVDSLAASIQKFYS